MRLNIEVVTLENGWTVSLGNGNGPSLNYGPDITFPKFCSTKEEVGQHVAALTLSAEEWTMRAQAERKRWEDLRAKEQAHSAAALGTAIRGQL